MKTLSRLFALTMLSLGMGLPLVGCVVETDTPGDNAVEPLDGDGLEFEGEGRIDD